MNNSTPTNHPRVKLGRINGDNLYSVILDMTIPYKAVLQERLTRLNAFTRSQWPKSGQPLQDVK